MSSIVQATARSENEGKDYENTKALKRFFLEGLATEYFIRGLPSANCYQMSNHTPATLDADSEPASEEQWINMRASNLTDVGY